jgi:hypothetical protein
LLIFGGDNFYPHGTRRYEDIKALEDVFSVLPCQICGVLGNHDYKGNINLQTGSEVLNVTSDVKTIEHGNMSIVLINTPVLDPLVHNDIFEICYNHEYYGQVVDMDTELSEKCASVEKTKQKHLQDLEYALSTIPNYRKKVVVGHYPLNSNGFYKRHMVNIYGLLMPLFAKYKVDLYLCGHEHNMQQHVWSGIELQNLPIAVDNEWMFTQYLCGSATGAEPYEFHVDDDDLLCVDYDVVNPAFLMIDNAGNVEVEVELIL